MTKRWPERLKEASVPPEVAGETVVIDGKTYVRSRNPYYLTYPAEPEYIFVEKGKEFVGLGGHYGQIEGQDHRQG